MARTYATETKRAYSYITPGGLAVVVALIGLFVFHADRLFSILIGGGSVIFLYGLFLLVREIIRASKSRQGC